MVFKKEGLTAALMALEACAAARINAFWKQGEGLHQVCEQVFGM